MGYHCHLVLIERNDHFHCLSLNGLVIATEEVDFDELILAVLAVFT